MENTFNIYTEITPEIPKLYHYTSQAGFMGIVNHKKIWFTNIHHMNDSTEYTYSLQMIRDIIKNLYDFGKDENNFLDQFPNPTDIKPIFTFSLSEKGDLLSQWRGYCPNGGYSIAFFDRNNYSQLSQMVKSNSLYIGRCLYDRNAIEEFIQKRIVTLTPKEFKTDKEEAERRNSLKKWLSEHYEIINKNTLKYAPLIKHEAFSEEHEWRIVANYAEYENRKKISIMAITHHPNTVTVQFKNQDPFEDLSDRLKFRQGKSFLIPYLEIPLIETKEPLLITEQEAELPISIAEVIVGPTPHKELSVRSCKLLLLNVNILLFEKNKEHKETVVTPSKLPYRNW